MAAFGQQRTLRLGLTRRKNRQLRRAVAAHFSREPGFPANHSLLSAMSLRAFFLLSGFARSFGDMRFLTRFSMLRAFCSCRFWRMMVPFH